MPIAACAAMVGVLLQLRTSEGGGAVTPRPLTFLFSRRQSEELAAEHVIREHHIGRVLSDILHDPYITDRCGSAEIRRLLDHPEIVRAVAEDVRHERGREHDG
jgi:hypothetical protein